MDSCLILWILNDTVKSWSYFICHWRVFYNYLSQGANRSFHAIVSYSIQGNHVLEVNKAKWFLWDQVIFIEFVVLIKMLPLLRFKVNFLLYFYFDLIKWKVSFEGYNFSFFLIFDLFKFLSAHPLQLVIIFEQVMKLIFLVLKSIVTI
jgi:hypothetical protein